MQQMLNKEVALAAQILDIRMAPAILLSESSKKLHGAMIC